MNFQVRVRPKETGAKPRVGAAYFRGGPTSLLGAWRPALREQQEDISRAWTDAAARAIDTLQNNGFIAGAIECCEAAIVGPKLRMASRPNFQALGWTEDQSKKWSDEVESAWEAWSSDPSECDAGGRMTFGQMQQLALRSYLTFGEVLSLLPMKPQAARRGGFMTKVLMLPPSRIVATSTEHITGAGREIINGVHVDEYGAPVAYRIRQKKKLLGYDEEVDIPLADSEGRRNVVHVFDPQLKTTRGISPLAPVLRVIRQIDQLQDATLAAALLQTLFAATLRTSLTGDAAFDGLTTEADAKKGAGLTLDGLLDAKSTWYDALTLDLNTPGRIAHLMPNDQLEFHEAKNPSAQYEAFVSWMMKEVARGLGVTYETATGDYRGATYSSVRIATAEAWQIVLKRRSNIVEPFSNAVFLTWLEEAIGTGKVSYRGGLDAFMAQRAWAGRVTWSGPPRPQADDLKAARAHQTLLEIGATSMQAIAAEYGSDIEDVLDQRARERAYALNRGLPDPYPIPPVKDAVGSKRDEGGSSDTKADDPSFVPGQDTGE